MVLSITQVSTIILFYFLATFGLSYLVTKLASTKSQFLVADRTLGVRIAAFSIAANWIWAPSLFVSGQKAFQQGWVGFFWFLIPNIACLLTFSWFANRVREMNPDGFTLSSFMRKVCSKRVQGLYLFAMTGLAACSFAVQLLAGATALNLLAGTNFYVTTIILAFGALIYSSMSGLRSSVVADYVQVAVILISAFILVPWTIHDVGGIHVLFKGLAGADHKYVSLFDANGLDVFLTFGLATTIGLMSGPFGDQSFWQRAFAVERKSVIKAFVYGAGIFALVPFSLSMLGFAAAGSGMHIKDPQMVNLEMITHFLPSWAICIFLLMLLSGLCSTLSSNLCAISSMAGHDLVGEALDKRSLRFARYAMLILTIVGIAIANIPGLKILHLFLFYGVLRASTLVPTMYTLITKKVSEKGVFYGILTAICVGLPLFAYGGLSAQWKFSVAGSLLTILAPLCTIILTEKEQLQ